MFRSVFCLCCFVFSQLAQAQVIDVQQYGFNLQLTDANDTLKGTATVAVTFLENRKQFHLNLASIHEGKGMQVKSVAAHDTSFSFTHVRDTLFIALPNEIKKDTTQTFVITYAGIPADGLIISKNKWGERTFFADNWPNRAQQWLPCNDRPDDKASVSFEVTAPARYKIISNGVLVEEQKVDSTRTFTHWREPTPIPTKVMVIGAARFAVKQFSDSSVAPVSAWVYPQDSAKGFYDYALAPSILKFYSGYIGPYPFEKLANVQSKTIFGGMENATAIFYAENTVTGKRKSEALLAHEIAHQWFGNSATEKSFAHLWLSEGFATYMTHLYLEQKYRRNTLIKRLQQDRNEVIRFAKRWPFPVVDSVSHFMDLLNANSYQKGGWVLHMLRQQVGDAVFKKIIQIYYDQYKYSNADTWDFEKVAEEVSGKELTWFFDQWLHRSGMPRLSFTYTKTSQGVRLRITQIQETPYRLTLPVLIDKKTVQFQISKHSESFLVGHDKDKRAIDPNCTVLFEEVKK